MLTDSVVKPAHQVPMPVRPATSASKGIPATAPCRVTGKAAAALAHCRALAKGTPRARLAARLPVKVSPAPMVSATGM